MAEGKFLHEDASYQMKQIYFFYFCYNEWEGKKLLACKQKRFCSKAACENPATYSGFSLL